MDGSFSAFVLTMQAKCNSPGEGENRRLVARRQAPISGLFKFERVNV